MLTRHVPLQRRAQLRNRIPLRARRREPRGPGLAQRVAHEAGTALAHRHAPSTVYRSQRHLAHVAALACARCGRQMRSQAAHLNLVALGKGRGLKASDALTVPLCADEPGARGCHWLLDQSGRLARDTAVELQLRWLQATRVTLTIRGQWPEAAEADYRRIVLPYLLRLAAAAPLEPAPAGEQESP